MASIYGFPPILTITKQLFHQFERDMTDQRPHTCALCGKSFANTCFLRRHVESVHLNRRPHICEHCDKSFARNDHLKNHLRSVHLKERRTESA
ncbi:unnamed protein product [Dicrocoelium dendriticum]|nr:unnamed protein product [Dicrocoelium dendriticum]